MVLTGRKAYIVAGTMKITDELCWMPAGWLYDNVLERLAEIVIKEDPELSSLLCRSTTLESVGWLDLREISDESFGKFFDAAKQAFNQAEKKGPDDFYDPKFYPGFVDRFRELLEMLEKAQEERTGHL